MEIKIFAQIEAPIDERFSRADSVTITLGDEAITAIANAIAAQQSVHLTRFAACQTCEYNPCDLANNSDYCPARK